MKRSLCLVVVCAAVAGCSTDQFARAVYYSLRVQNQAVEQSTPGEPGQREIVPFERYQQERRGAASR